MIPDSPQIPPDKKRRRIISARVYTDFSFTALVNGAVDVVLEGESTPYRLFTFYPDELAFSASEFVGKTADVGAELKYRKDVAYLRS